MKDQVFLYTSWLSNSMMSGSQDTDPNQGREQGGQQPAAGQPQGGQPAGGQPQGGQPPQGQPAAGQAGDGDGGLPDEVKDWAIYITAIFGIAGAGYGVLWLILDAVEEFYFEPDGNGFEADLGFGVMFGEVTMLGATAALLLATTFVGVWMGRNLEEDDQTTFKIAAAGCAAGVVVYLVISALLISIAADGISIDFGGTLINGIVTALFAAGVAAGGVWVARNQAPE